MRTGMIWSRCEHTLAYLENAQAKITSQLRGHMMAGMSWSRCEHPLAYLQHAQAKSIRQQCSYRRA